MSIDTQRQSKHTTRGSMKVHNLCGTFFPSFSLIPRIQHSNIIVRFFADFILTTTTHAFFFFHFISIQLVQFSSLRPCNSLSSQHQLILHMRLSSHIDIMLFWISSKYMRIFHRISIQIHVAFFSIHFPVFALWTPSNWLAWC